MDDKRQRRLERNEIIRQANKARNAINELRQRQPMVTIVMSPRKPTSNGRAGRKGVGK